MLPEIEKKKQWNDNDGRNRSHNNNNVITGAFLLLAGAGILLRNMNVGIPYWVFSWQMLLIGIGLFIGLRHNFKGPVWFVLILIGVIFLQGHIFPGFNLRQYTWPVILMALGLYFILRPATGVIREKGNEDTQLKEPMSYGAENFTAADRVDATSVFGNIKKVVVSKNFTGGEIVAFMGGCDINLSQADIHGKVRLEATNFMGGTKLIVPANWDVQSELVAIFGGVEDKRDMRSVTIDPHKILVLEGTCMFGGIEIRNY